MAGAEDLVGRAMEAMTRFDVVTLKGCFHRDVVLVEPDGLPYGGEYEGAEGFFGLLGELNGLYELGYGDVEVFDGADAAAVRFTVSFRSRRTGEGCRMPFVAVFDVADGLITRIDVYPKDVATLAQFMTQNM